MNTHLFSSKHSNIPIILSQFICKSVDLLNYFIMKIKQKLEIDFTSTLNFLLDEDCFDVRAIHRRF